MGAGPVPQQHLALGGAARDQAAVGGRGETEHGLRLAGQAVAQRLQFGVPTLQPPVDRPGDDVAAAQHREAGQREIVRRELQLAHPVQHAPRPQHALMAASQDLAAAIGEGGHALAALIERGQLGAIGQPPAMDAPVPAAGGELGAVRCQRDRGELRLGLKPPPQLARGEVPDQRPCRRRRR